MREVTSLEEGHDVERVTETMRVSTLAVVKLARKTVESASEVINNVEVPQIHYIDRVVDIPVCVEDGDLHSLERLVYS